MSDHPTVVVHGVETLGDLLVRLSAVLVDLALAGYLLIGRDLGRLRRLLAGIALEVYDRLDRLLVVGDALDEQGVGLHGLLDRRLLETLEILKGEMAKTRAGQKSELMDLLIGYRWNEMFGGLDRDPATIEWKNT